ncbi:MAG: hypothetical protein KJZ91_22015 [Myxococcales bacterium]|nr:hypothetical protein [Myxococcales bacterium]
MPPVAPPADAPPASPAPSEVPAAPPADALATAPAAAPPRHAVWIALPSVDGLAGLEVGAERALRPRTAVALAVSVRRTAAGDYDALRLGVAGEYRWYWRGRARWSRIPGLDRTGWFVGGRVDLSTARLSLGDRHLGTTLVAGARAEVGYRLTPWRRLALTAMVGLGASVERDAAGRLPAQGHPALGVGLDAGWMF